MRSLDIETLGAPRVNSHDPCTEVNIHYKWIQRLQLIAKSKQEIISFCFDKNNNLVKE